MALNLLAPVVNYQSMLNRIFWFTSAAAIGAVCLLRVNVPEIEIELKRINFDLDTGSGSMLSIPGGYLLPALGVGLIARVFRIHGHFAHWLGIRERFDIDVIINALTRESGIDVESVSDDQWVTHRHDIMRQAFYRFTGNKTLQIDEHLIHQALDSWSWFWIGIEATLIFMLSGMSLIALGSYSVGAVTILGSLLLASVGLPAIRNQCRCYAIAQVKTIVSDPARTAVVRQAFDWTAVFKSHLKRTA